MLLLKVFFGELSEFIRVAKSVFRDGTDEVFDIDSQERRIEALYVEAVEP